MAAESAVVPAHEIIIASSEAEIQQCYNVRIDVFVHEQKFPLDTEPDSLDPIATHFLLRLTPSLQPIGTIRGSKHSSSDGEYYKLSRLAILKDYRKLKLGRELVLALHDWIKKDAPPESPSVRIVCHSQIPVKAFYGKYGYVPEGEEFDEDGEPHQRMVLQLQLT